ncbi:hypothetical protein EV424DRAFT_256671 [Suillus variegatus]|nr:hypothetical protein EV424DRAFT_256671 [Suillus variegatus]
MALIRTSKGLINMFVRVFLFSAILLLCLQASVNASNDSTDCGSGTIRCCQEDPSQPGNVNDEECQSYAETCASGYLAACCYTVPNLVSAAIQFNSAVDLSWLATVLLLLRAVSVRLRGVAGFLNVMNA